MIKETLNLMISGTLTINEIAIKLKISKDELLTRLAFMEHLGYLRSVGNTNSDHDNKDQCLFCPEIKTCSMNNLEQQPCKMYVITDKGRRVIGK